MKKMKLWKNAAGVTTRSDEAPYFGSWTEVGSEPEVAVEEEVVQVTAEQVTHELVPEDEAKPAEPMEYVDVFEDFKSLRANGKDLADGHQAAVANGTVYEKVNGVWKKAEETA